MKNSIQALNYSAHAIADLAQRAREVRGKAPVTASVIDQLIVLLRDSVKFILPNRCELLDSGTLRQAHLELVRLPYPVVAFEAPWASESVEERIGDHAMTKSSKRIALCFEARRDMELLPGMNDVLDHPKFAAGGVFVVAISYIDSDDKWQVAPGAAFLGYGTQLQKSTESPEAGLGFEHEASDRYISGLMEAGLVRKNAAKFLMEAVVLLPEIYSGLLMIDGDEVKTRTRLYVDTRDEVMTLVQACAVINCQNVASLDVPAPAALNKKRLAKGKVPFFSYKVLQLSDDLKPLPGAAQGGTHASPRMHLRRGHLRSLDSDRRVWVRPAIVNAGSDKGVADKDYGVLAR
jgi:hypothetical protein